MYFLYPFLLLGICYIQLCTHPSSPVTINAIMLLRDYAIMSFSLHHPNPALDYTVKVQFSLRSLELAPTHTP